MAELKQFRNLQIEGGNKNFKRIQLTWLFKKSGYAKQRLQEWSAPTQGTSSNRRIC